MNIKGRDVVIVDDMVDTAATLVTISERLHQAGAKKIILCAAHGLFAENAVEVINRSPVTKIIVSDSLPLPKVSCSKVEQVSIADYLADVIVAEHLQHQHPNTKEVEESFEDDDA